MTCNACGEKPKDTAKDFTKAVVEINNPETLVLLRKVVIPASMGTEEQVPAAIGKYHNVILHYEANKHTYLYSSDGIPTLLEMDVSQEVLDKIGDLSTLLTTDKTSVVAAINELAGEIEEGGNNIVELTREHYNFPVDNPQGIAVWLLDPNYIYINKTEDLLFVPDGTTTSYVHELEGIFLVTPTQDYQNRCSVIYFSCDGEQSLGEWSGVGTYATYDQSTGELVDSGSFLSEKQIVQTTGQSTTDVMSQKAVTQALNGKANTSAIPTRVGQLTNDSGYQTASQVSSAIASAVGGITSFEYEVVQTLPSTGEAGKIYLVANGGTTPNIYDEYIWVNNAFEKIGTTEIDLSNYYTKTQTDTLLGAKANQSTTYTKAEVDTALGNKANSSDVYSKSEVNTALAGKQDTIDASHKLDADLIDSSASDNKTYQTGASAPTTSTVGSVGELYVDKSTGAVYVCTSTTGGTYTWEEVSNSSGAIITMTTTDPGEGVALAANHFIGVYE